MPTGRRAEVCPTGDGRGRVLLNWPGETAMPGPHLQTSAPKVYRLMLNAAEEARQGRDALAQMADSVARKTAKARNRLAHLS